MRLRHVDDDDEDEDDKNRNGEITHNVVPTPFQSPRTPSALQTWRTAS